jgi:hypothetical protein
MNNDISAYPPLPPPLKSHCTVQIAHGNVMCSVIVQVVKSYVARLSHVNTSFKPCSGFLCWVQSDHAVTRSCTIL